VSGENYISANVSEKCYTNQYWGWTLGFLVPALGVLVFGIPFMMF